MREVPHEQVAGVCRRRVGDCVVTAINDGCVIIPAEVLQGITVDERDVIYQKAGRRAPFASSINGYLVQSADQTILIDAGGGKLMGPEAGRLKSNLSAAGVAPEDIDIILMTHMHPDHAGGLVTPGGAATFPNATLYVAQAELEYWLETLDRDAEPESEQAIIDNARLVKDLYAGRMENVVDGQAYGLARAISLRGHTPGHTGYMIENGGDRLLTWSDICYVPDSWSAAHCA